MEKIKLREAEYINVQQALEWLAMGWIPYIDNDERLTAEDRENARGYFNGEKIREEDEYFYTEAQLDYCEKMYKAVGALENLLNRQVITLNANYIKESLVSRITEIEKGDVFFNFSLFCSDCEESRFYVTAESFLLNKHFLIDDFYCLKFSELKKVEPLITRDKPSAEKTQAKTATQAIDTAHYTTPYLNILNKCIVENIDIIKNGKKDTLKEKIIEYSRQYNIEIGDVMVRYMATILRQPERQTGGAQPQKENIKNN